MYQLDFSLKAIKPLGKQPTAPFSSFFSKSWKVSFSRFGRQSLGTPMEKAPSSSCATKLCLSAAMAWSWAQSKSETVHRWKKLCQARTEIHRLIQDIWVILSNRGIGRNQGFRKMLVLSLIFKQNLRTRNVLERTKSMSYVSRFVWCCLGNRDVLAKVLLSI